ncbi:MAG: hypothetical protein HY321_08100 [Armatimonadetes bacterium]|nr:hypothetical protein [Armatimonadota bacterium]
MRNPQFKNVGNRGDVTKHRLLVDSLQLITERFKDTRTLVYVDTHAFAFRAPLSKNAGPIAHRGADDLYAQFEEAEQAATGKCLCSPGLAAGATAGFRERRFLICEKDPVQLAFLKCDFAQEGVDSVRFRPVFSGKDLAALVESAHAPFVYMLIDPFRYEHDKDAVRAPVAAADRLDHPTVLQIFNYGAPIADELIGPRWKQTSIEDYPFCNKIAWNPSADRLLGPAESHASCLLAAALATLQ